MGNLPKKFLNLKRISIQIVSIISNNKMKGYNMLSPIDVAENTDTMYTPSEIAKMGATGSFSYIPGGKGQQTVDDWR